MVAVAIDGPAGAGKSTIARTAAAELGFIYIDTGALYRTIGLSCINKGIDCSDTEKVIPVLSQIKIDLKFIDGEQRMFLDDEDVSGLIRTEEVSMSASKVSAIPEVRAYLLELQRGFAKTNNVIMDGRDIGTVVLPGADVKIFLTASSESRAMRRFLQLKEKGIDGDYDSILQDIIKRDHNDMTRETAPLKAADNAVTIDTTELDLLQSIESVISVIKERLK